MHLVWDLYFFQQVRLKKYLAAGFLVKTIFLVEKPYEEIITTEFGESYGALVEELDIKKDSVFIRYYYPIFMVRRALYAGILIVLSDSPTLQIGLIELVIYEFPNT